MLERGDPTPLFAGRSNINPNFQFGSVAGRYVVISFFRSAQDEAGQRFLSEIERHSGRFDVDNFFFFGVTTDPVDEQSPRLLQKRAGAVYFFDTDLSISRAFGIDMVNGSYERQTFVLDHGLRVLAVLPWGQSPEAHVARLLATLAALPPLAESATGCAPVLCLTNIFEREFCNTLIELYQRNGGEDSGFMRDVQGKTTLLHDYSHKRRMDYELTDQRIIEAAHTRLRRRLVPEIQKAFQFNPTRIERNLIACYDAAVGGHFRAHRDNTTKGTAHRRFAVTINLNTEEFEGGQLWFPEFGRRAYRAPTGGAVVFSCSLLHEARPVTHGVRYAYLPFLYDEEAARIRQSNLQFIAKRE